MTDIFHRKWYSILNYFCLVSIEIRFPWDIETHLLHLILKYLQQYNFASDGVYLQRH